MCLGMLGFKVYQIIMHCKEDDKHVCVCLSASPPVSHYRETGTRVSRDP